MHLSSEPPVFLVNKSRVDPRRPWVFAEQDEGVGMGVGLSFVRAESRCRVGWLFVHCVPLPHGPPHHRLVVHSVFDETRRVETALMVHFHRAEVGRYIVLEASRAPNDGDAVHYATYLRTTRPSCPPLRSSRSASAPSSSSSSRRRFFARGGDGPVGLNEGVLTWSLKAPQVMGSRFDERSFARVPELSEDVGDIGDDEAARRGSQGLDVAFTILEELTASFMSLAMSVTPLDCEEGVKPTRIILRSLTLHSAASLALFFISVQVSNQKHRRWASVFTLAWRSCSSAHHLAVVFDAGTPEARCRRQVERLAAVR